MEEGWKKEKVRTWREECKVFATPEADERISLDVTFKKMTFVYSV